MRRFLVAAASRPGRIVAHAAGAPLRGFRAGPPPVVAAGVSYYEIHRSARKHGIADEDIEHAVTHAMARRHRLRRPSVHRAARNAGLLEAPTIPTVEGPELAIHAKRMRPKYRHLLSEQ